MKKIQQEIDRLNPQLLSLLPILRERLKAKVGNELSEWLAKGFSKAVIVRKGEESQISLIPAIQLTGAIQEDASGSWYLDMDGWEGFQLNTALTTDDVEAILKAIDKLIETRLQANGLKRLLEEIEQGVYSGEDQEAAIFFVYGAMLEDGVSEEVADLWILESGLDKFDYLFMLESGTNLNQVWRLCVDVLPDELIPVLDHEYI